MTTELLDWIKREDYRRLSLHLSSALTVGATRLTLEQSRRLLLDIISIRGNAARAARAALALRSNQIDLNTNQSMNQTQLVFGDEEVGNFDATLLDQEADQNLFVVPNPVGPFGPDPTLMREFDVPSNAEIENPDDPFADNFGEDPTRPSLTNFDDIFGNIACAQCHYCIHTLYHMKMVKKYIDHTPCFQSISMHVEVRYLCH